MINNPIKINDYTSPVESSRHEFMKENSHPDTKNFNTYKGFVTEKDRIKSLADKTVIRTESCYKQTASTKESLYRPKTQENSLNKSKLTLISKIVDKHDTSKNSPLKEENELNTLLNAINQYNPQKFLEREYVQEKLQKINANFSKRNEEGEENFYLESQENYEEYCKFINSKNRIAIMRAIREKSIDVLVDENFKMVKKQKKIKNNFFTHNNCCNNDNYKSNKNGKEEDEGAKLVGDFKNRRSDDTNENDLYSLNDNKIKLKEKKNDSDSAIINIKTHFNATAVIANRLKQEELLKNKDKHAHEFLFENRPKVLGTCASNKAFAINNFTKFSNLNTIEAFKPTKNNFETEVLKYLKLPESKLMEKESRKVFTAKEKTNAQSRNDNYVFCPSNKRNKNNSKANSIRNTINPDKKSFYKTLSNFMNHTSNNTLFKSIAGKFNLEEAKLDMMESNPLVYNLSFNPLKEQVNKMSQNQDTEKEQLNKLEYLKNIAFAHNSGKNGKSQRKVKRLGTRGSNGEADFLLNFDNESNAYEENFDKLKTEMSNKIQNHLNANSNAGNNTDIKQRVYFENSLNSKQNMDKIAKEILKKCNFIHEKK